MGLTIHYTIEFTGTAKQLQMKLEKIKQACRDLPFEEVGERVEVVKVTKEHIKVWEWLQAMLSYPNNLQDNLSMRDLIMEKIGVPTDKMLDVGEWREKGNSFWRVLKPTTMVSLYLYPGQGCDSSELNFQRLRGKFICRSFCKTQYAEEFVKCHLLVIQVLDMLKAEEGFEVEVCDEGKYWETRDMKVLADNINESTALLSGLIGGIKAAAEEQGMVVDAPIENCKNLMRVDEKEGELS